MLGRCYENGWGVDIDRDAARLCYRQAAEKGDYRAAHNYACVLAAEGCIAGALLGQASQAEYQALDDYGKALGEAFQIADDLLDVEGDASALGKQTGQDAALGKTTFVTQLGISGAKQRVRDLLARADAALSIFGARGDVLRAAARFVAERKN